MRFFFFVLFFVIENGREFWYNENSGDQPAFA